MKQSKLVILILSGLLIFFIIPAVALAHQPRVVESKWTEVENPEISQAFYGELKGQPDFFVIKTSGPFKFYLNILVPDIIGGKESISADVFKDIDDKGNKSFEALLDGKKYSWTNFYEPFAGDSYWQGPEIKKDASEGIYTIRVFNSKNLGKYVLAVGEQEKFSLGETITTIKILPRLKADFFNKSPLTAYFNYTGLFLLGFATVALIIILLIWKCFKARSKK